MDRQSSFLPTIKCSDCGVDIDISQLADHVCALAVPSKDDFLPPKLDRAATFGGSALNDDAPGQQRPGRMAPPPRIDPYAANKPFQPQNELTPLSNYSDPKSFSPLSPQPLSPRNGKSPFKMNRSATSPMPQPRARSPSADMSLNMDNPYPSFPTSSRGTPIAERPKLSPVYPDANPLYAPLSPRTNGGEGVLKRLDTIAPGPFDRRGGDSRPSTSNGPRSPAQQQGPGFGHRRTATQNSINDERGPAQRTSQASVRSRTSTFSNGSIGLPSRPKPGFGAMPPPPPPPPPAMNEGIDAFLSRLQKETMEPKQAGQDSRSRTAPDRQESRSVNRPPPRPQRPSDTERLTKGGVDTGYSKPALRANNMFPARSASRGGSQSGQSRDELPLPPVPTYEKELPAKPLHTPSDSGLSDDSVSSAGFGSTASSRSSPPTSEIGYSRVPSKSGRPEYFGEDLIPRAASPESFLESPPRPRVDDQRGQRNYHRFKAPGSLQPPPIPFSDAPESPLDPAIQKVSRVRKAPTEPRPMTNYAPPAVLPRETPKRSQTEPRAPPSRRPTATNKSKCRGCGELITGKSVKDSSGRLTGRWHKECFVCRTCSSPFPSAEFYVFENFPYCEQHYHKLNGSLCTSCNIGIEGQYLETDRLQKFHPRCFSCFTCRIVLRDDYYEVNGRNYCDRHAYAAQQQNNAYLGPGANKNRNLQKRRTRMMMMMA